MFTGLFTITTLRSGWSVEVDSGNRLLITFAQLNIFCFFNLPGWSRSCFKVKDALLRCARKGPGVHGGEVGLCGKLDQKSENINNGRQLQLTMEIRMSMTSNQNPVSRPSPTSGSGFSLLFPWPSTVSTHLPPSICWCFRNGLDKSSPRSHSLSRAGSMPCVLSSRSLC